MKLLLLNCPVCSRPLAPGDDDVVVGCGNCRSPIALHDDRLALASLAYARPGPNQRPDRWLPFWLFQGQVSLRKRETQGGGSRIGRTAAEFWSKPRYFYVPAWEISMVTVREIGAELIRHQPRYTNLPENPYPDLPFVSASVTVEDAKKLLEFIVLDIEVGRDDWLKKLDFSLALSEPSFWALPAVGSRLVALT